MRIGINCGGIRDSGLQRLCTHIDALPSCKVMLHVVRCPHGPYFIQVKGYPANPKTIGEAIRKRRLDLSLRQIDVAEIIGFDEITVVNSEKGRCTPHIKHMPCIFRFLHLSIPGLESPPGRQQHRRANCCASQITWSHPEGICLRARGRSEHAGTVGAWRPPTNRKIRRCNSCKCALVRLVPARS